MDLRSFAFGGGNPAGRRGHISIHVDELVHVEQRAAEFGEAALLDEGEAGAAFVCVGGALQCEGEGAVDLFRGLSSRFAFHTFGQRSSGFDGEGTVEQ